MGVAPHHVVPSQSDSQKRAPEPHPQPAQVQSDTLVLIFFVSVFCLFFVFFFLISDPIMTKYHVKIAAVTAQIRLRCGFDACEFRRPPLLTLATSATSSYFRLRTYATNHSVGVCVCLFLPCLYLPILFVCLMNAYSCLCLPTRGGGLQLLSFEVGTHLSFGGRNVLPHCVRVGT